ncbi:MAG: DUF4954 family protein [Spirochaetes bacterium]|nr:DUF4954 family protein [Spirochaetota bacterium]
MGSNCHISNVNYLANYQIKDECILHNIDELFFHHSDIPEYLFPVKVANENSGRSLTAFPDMIPADTFLFYKFKDDEKLQEKLQSLTYNQYSKLLIDKGLIEKHCVIKHTKIIKNLILKEKGLINNCQTLKNCFIHSNHKEQTVIEDGAIIKNAIIGCGAFISDNAIIHNFICGSYCKLLTGIRVFDTYLGDNSTLACCEVISNLIYPFHEQHHNNSFLIATTLLGQSNIAAGATIGSNHNSRANDGEILVNRGFWPGLCTNLKHNSRFASFSLIAKGNYDHEIYNPYPFSLIVQSKQKSEITIIPAYWFIYNQYALERNSYKFKNRDKRKTKLQHIETAYLAPDTISEIISAITRLEELISDSTYHYLPDPGSVTDKDVMNKYGGIIQYPKRAIDYYQKMIEYYIISTLINYYQSSSTQSLNFLNQLLEISKLTVYEEWINLGGQIIPQKYLTQLINGIKNNHFASWSDIHQQYDQYQEKYLRNNLRYALYCFEYLYKQPIHQLNQEDLLQFLNKSKTTLADIKNKVYQSRKKDYDDPWRYLIYDNRHEMAAVLGTMENNDFINYFDDKINQQLKVIDEIIAN